MRRPNFFIVGAPRCGTTAMYDYLRQHPDIFMPYRKEPVYFGADLHKRPPVLDEAGYLGLFRGAGTERRLGEATVWYLYSASAAQEIHDFDPAARIIIMLRNPVDMIYSLHSHFLFSANEEIEDFGQALAAEEDRRNGRRIPPTARRPEGLQYRAVGRYAEHVRRWLAVFGSEQVRVIVFEDFAADVAASYRDTLEFLGVDSAFRADLERVNENKRVRSQAMKRLIHAPWFVSATARLPGPLGHRVWRGLKRVNLRTEQRRKLDPGLRRQLQEEFAPDVAALGALLGRDLSAWSTPADAVAVPAGAGG